MVEPHVYLLHGEDDFAISTFALKFKDSMVGDPSILDMNITLLDGRTNNLDHLVQAVNSLPFLVSHRLVFFNHPSDIAKSDTLRKKMFGILSNVPETTLLVMVEDKQLLPPEPRRKDAKHWLDKWASQAGPAVQTKLFNLPDGQELNTWIINRMKAEGGQITPAAAARLGQLIGPESKILKTEIQKLLAYVNYARPIEREDVEHVAAPIQRVENFALLNALRAHNLQMALKALRLELDQREPIMVFSGIVGQFRNLILAREMLDTGGRPEDLAAAAKINPYVAKLAMEQARSYKLNELEEIYHQLIELDEMMKGGSSDPEAALDVMVTKLTLQ